MDHVIRNSCEYVTVVEAPTDCYIVFFPLNGLNRRWSHAASIMLRWLIVVFEKGIACLNFLNRAAAFLWCFAVKSDSTTHLNGFTVVWLELTAVGETFSLSSSVVRSINVIKKSSTEVWHFIEEWVKADGQAPHRKQTSFLIRKKMASCFWS